MLVLEQQVYYLLACWTWWARISEWCPSISSTWADPRTGWIYLFKTTQCQGIGSYSWTLCPRRAKAVSCSPLSLMFYHHPHCPSAPWRQEAPHFQKVSLKFTWVKCAWVILKGFFLEITHLPISTLGWVQVRELVWSLTVSPVLQTVSGTYWELNNTCWMKRLAIHHFPWTGLIVDMHLVLWLHVLSPNMLRDFCPIRGDQIQICDILRASSKIRLITVTPVLWNPGAGWGSK